MTNTLYGILNILLYFAICATTALVLKYFIKIPAEVFRKILHMILLGSLVCWIFCFDKWWVAALSSFTFALIAYPFLSWAENFSKYSQLLTERKAGEIKKSLLVVFTMFSLVIIICWGIFNDKLLSLASVFAWGFGDAAAALIGKKFGKHKLSGKHIEGVKSIEGTLAMFIISFISVITVLIFRGDLTVYAYIIISLITAGISALTELFTKNGMDTITCPLVSMSTLIILLYIFGGLA